MGRSASRWRMHARLVLAGALVLGAAAPAAASTPARDLLDAGPGPLLSAAAGIARWAAYLAVLVTAGGAAFLAWAHRGRDGEARAVARVIAAVAGAGIVVTVLRIPLQAMEIGGFTAVADLGAWEAVLASPFGLTSLAIGGGLVVTLLALARLDAPPGRTLAVVGGVVAAGALAFTGHSAVGEPRWLSLTAMAVHNGAAAVWSGGLIALVVVLRRVAHDPDPALAGTVERFSAAATASIVAVGAAGGAAAWVHVGAWSALWGTDYGRVLAVKVALVAAAVAAGAYNRQRLVPALRREPDVAWPRLRRVVGLEVAGVVAIVALTAALADLTPARVAAGIGEIFSDVAALDEAVDVQLVIDPNRVGLNEAHLYLLDTAGRPADVAEDVQLRFIDPDGADSAEVPPRRAGPGHYLHIGAELDRPGRWRVEVHVMVEGEHRTATFEVVPGRGAQATVPADGAQPQALHRTAAP